MSRRSENIAFKVMPNGNIRAYQADKPDKSGVSELQFTNPENESPTVIIGNTIKIIETNMTDQNTVMTDQNTVKLPLELKGKKFRIRKLTPKECFRLMGVDDKDIDKIQAAGVSNSGQYKLAGNSIVVDVLYHIFRKMFIETDVDKNKEPQQLSLF
jgi:DNA (cytosine-5)-methyltransferase 1